MKTVTQVGGEEKFVTQLLLLLCTSVYKHLRQYIVVSVRVEDWSWYRKMIVSKKT